MGCKAYSRERYLKNTQNHYDQRQEWSTEWRVMEVYGTSIIGITRNEAIELTSVESRPIEKRTAGIF